MSLKLEDETFTRSQGHVLAEVEATAGRDVYSLPARGRSVSVKEFGITCHLKGRCLVATIDDGDDGVAMPTSCHDVNTFPRCELCHVATDDGLIAPTPLQQPTQPLEHVLLVLRASAGREGVALVAGEAAGEVLAHVTVVTSFVPFIRISVP